MNQGVITFEISQIFELIRTENIPAKKIELLHNNHSIEAYKIDDKYILRISKSTMDEQMKQDRVKSVSFVPKIHTTGSFTASGQKYCFMISDYVSGNDLFSILLELTDEQKINIGKEIAHFLIELHSITDSAYDIGHYIPSIPRYKQSWKDGHLEYIKLLRTGLSEMYAKIENERIISEAFDYIHANINCLEYQTRPRLLHNDLHPSTI